MKEIIKKRSSIGSADTTQDEMIEYYIEFVKAQIFKYCNIRTLPRMLEFVVIEKVITLLEQDKELKKDIKSVSRGDTKIEYSSKSSKISLLKGDILGDVKRELAPYRKIAPINISDLDEEVNL